MEREIIGGNTDPQAPKAAGGLTTIFNAGTRAASDEAALRKAVKEASSSGGSAAMESEESAASSTDTGKKAAAERESRVHRIKLIDSSPVVLAQRPMSSVAATCGTDGSIVTIDVGAADPESTILRLALPARPPALEARIQQLKDTASGSGAAGGGGASSSSSSSATPSSGAGSSSPAAGALDGVHPGAFDEVTSLQWSPDSKYIAAGAADGRVVAWRSDSTDPAATMVGHDGPCMGAEFSVTGAYLGSYGADGRVVLWDPDDWTRHSVITEHGAAVLGMGWQTDTVFATCSADRMVYLHRMGSTKPVRTFQGHSAPVTVLRWDAGRSLIATGSDDSSVRVWSPKEGLVAWLTGHSEEISDISWAPVGFDGKAADKTISPVIASCSFDGSVRLWDAKSGRCSARIAAHSSMACSVAFSPSGATVASGGADGDLVVSSLADGRIAARVHLDAPVHAVMWDGARGERAWAALADGTLACVDLRAGKAE